MTKAIRWSPEQLAAHQAKVNAAVPTRAPAPKVRARGRQRVKGMNGLETAYAAHLEAQKLAGIVAWYKFEAIKLRLAASTFLDIDFFVMLADGTLEAHECKGHWEDDARVKIKVAADIYPFRFIGITRKPKKAGGGWDIEEF